MNRLRLGSAFVYLLLTSVSAVHAQAKPPASDSEVITVDGEKNPELIPNWAAWLEAFRLMAGPAAPIEPIPTVILSRHLKGSACADSQGGAVRHGAGTGARSARLEAAGRPHFANISERSDQADALEMKRRRAALDARDRLLAALPADGQAALREFAEHTRKGYKATMLKSKLAQFLAPE
jgi:hypothetical protein